MKSPFNRYRRGLEACPQAKTSKSGHAIFFYFVRRVRATSMTQRRIDNSRVHFWTFSPVSVNKWLRPKKYLPDKYTLFKIQFKVQLVCALFTPLISLEPGSVPMSERAPLSVNLPEFSIVWEKSLNLMVSLVYIRLKYFD